MAIGRRGFGRVARARPVSAYQARQGKAHHSHRRTISQAAWSLHTVADSLDDAPDELHDELMSRLVQLLDDDRV